MSSAKGSKGLPLFCFGDFITGFRSLLKQPGVAPFASRGSGCRTHGAKRGLGAPLRNFSLQQRGRAESICFVREAVCACP
jgi:hypothetical protein